jgi:mannose-6-phosphate isomerase
VREPSTRVWPQTEWLKAALIYGAPDDALAASRGLAGFLQAARPGLWRERMDGDGARPDGPAPATSLYHIMGAVTALLGASARLRC